METNELRAAIEAILFISSDPIKVDELSESFDESKETIATQLDEIKRVLDERAGGFMLEQTAGGWRLATRPEHDGILKKHFAKKGENRMSIAALETLAIVAYRQPITAPEVSEIRGVNATAVIRTLLERRMIRVSGRKNVVGSPFLYRTTKEFLVHFGLNDIRDLPRLEEFGDLIGENINEDLVTAIQSVEPGAGNVEGEESSSEHDGRSLAALGMTEDDDATIDNAVSSEDGDEEGVIPSRADGEESPAQESGRSLAALGMTPEDDLVTRDDEQIAEPNEETQLESVASDSAEEE
jgi:segregation and condensation protein B